MILQSDMTVFLLRNGDEPKFLTGRTLSEERDDSGSPIHRVRIEGTDAADLGEWLRLYYPVDNAYWCLPCAVSAIEASDSGHDLSLQARGDARQAEPRRTGRIQAHLSGITASVAGKAECIVINIGDRGMAIVSNEAHVVGSTVAVDLRWHAESWQGKMTVKHEETAVGTSRTYGLQCAEGKSGDALRVGLKRITATVTFQQGVLDEMWAERCGEDAKGPA